MLEQLARVAAPAAAPHDPVDARDSCRARRPAPSAPVRGGCAAISAKRAIGDLRLRPGGVGELGILLAHPVAALLRARHQAGDGEEIFELALAVGRSCRCARRRAARRIPLRSAPSSSHTVRMMALTPRSSMARLIASCTIMLGLESRNLADHDQQRSCRARQPERRAAAGLAHGGARLRHQLLDRVRASSDRRERPAAAPACVVPGPIRPCSLRRCAIWSGDQGA